MTKEEIHERYTNMCNSITDHYLEVGDEATPAQTTNLLQQYNIEMEAAFQSAKQLLIDNDHIKEEISPLADIIITCSHCGEQMEGFDIGGYNYYRDKNGHYPGQVFYVTPDGTETRVKDIDRKKVMIIGQVTRRDV